MPKKMSPVREPQVSEAVRVLVEQCRVQIQQATEAIGALALRDAKLDPKDGWRFDVERCVYVKLK